LTIASLVLAGLSRCAVADLCPTDRELLAAVRQRADAVASHSRDNADPNEVVLVERYNASAVSDVHCGDALEEDAGSTNCSFTLLYARSVIFRIARLSQRNGHWVITEDGPSVALDRP
jgi:hypothetical protein